MYMALNRSISEKPKILIITRFFPDDYKGGAEYVIYNIWNRAKQHYNVELISGWINDSKLLPPNTYAVNLKSSNKFIRYFKLYFAVKKLAKKIEPDIIHTNTIEVPELNIPTIITSHHIGHLLGNVKQKPNEKIIARFQKFIVKKRYKKFKKIIAVSKSTKNDLIKLGINEKKIQVIYNGIEIDKFKPINKKTKQEKNKFIILHQSRISKEKGQHISIKAIKLLSNNIKRKIKLYIVGFASDQKYLKKIKKLSRDLPIEIKINVLKKEEYFQKSDLVIFPTLMTEGFGLVLAEALCCKRPVIASDFPAIREVIKNNGMLIPPNQPRALSNAIIRLYKNKKLRQKFAENGRNFVLHNFSWDIAFKEYREIYDDILSIKKQKKEKCRKK